MFVSSPSECGVSGGQSADAEEVCALRPYEAASVAAADGRLDVTS